MEQIIEKLRENNIKINVVDDQLKLKIPAGFDATDILVDIRSHKQELIDFIKSMKTGKGFEVIKPAEKKEYYALSSVQKRLFFLYQFDNQSMAYNLFQTVLLEGDVDRQKLQRAFGKLIARHEPLRTAFLIQDGESVQKVMEHVEFEIEYFESTASEVNEVVDSFARPFDLSAGKPIRVGLIAGEKGGEEADTKQHILMVDIHHIVADGTSLGILIKDFMALYREEELLPLKLQYKDFSEWQQSEPRQKQVAKHKAFWTKEFSEEISPLKLPTDFKRPMIMSNAGAYRTFALEAEPLESLAKSEGTTLFILLLSIYNVLLSKLGNVEDVVIGTPIAGRYHSELEDMVGMFVPALPLRNYPKGQLTFSEFLRAVNSKTPECFDNQSYEYEELLEELKIERNISHNPLFDYMFSLQNFEKSELSISDLNVKSFNNSQSSALFDLTLVASQMGEHIGFSISYSTELFTAETIDRFVGYFTKIVSTVVSNRQTKLSAIDILPKQEREQIINEFNKPIEERDSGQTLLAQIEQQVKINPTQKAVIFKDSFLSYEALNSGANQLANYLVQEHKVQIEDKIGIYFDRSPEAIVALLAILKSGACFIPLDPDYPKERIDRIVESSEPKLILTNIGNDLKAIKSNISIVDINTTRNVIKGHSEHNPAIAFTEEDLAYIIYTSGSTGIPKGVMIDHASMLDYTTTFKEYFSVTSTDKVIHQSSLTFDTCIEEIFPALISGASVVMMPEGGRDVDAIVETIQRTEASILSTTPLVLSALNSRTDVIDSLRAIISGGDLLLPGHVDRLVKNHNIYNTYGPSESTVCISYHKIEDVAQASLIGRPINNRQVFVVNKAGDLCPIGSAGQLCVSGKGLARGYLGDKDLTRTKFIENPFVPGERMYRTGDLARWLSDGTLEFQGRVDAQVKIRGVRIELKEIEQHLLTYDGIYESVVLAKGEEGDKYLVAYYVSDSELEPAHIRNYLADILPNYMIPAFFIHLNHMPMTANGAKLDKKALPDPDADEAKKHEAPATQIEQTLHSIWSDVLNVDKDKLSVTKSFFQLGGHSLKATVLVNQIYEQMNVKVALLEVFRRPSIRELATLVESTSTKRLVHKDLVLLNSNDSQQRQNLFFIHDGSGDVQGYLELSEQLQNQYNCWAIRSNTLNDLAPQNTTIEALATQYLSLIMGVQNEGPFYLMGWSTGGVIAHEVAAQLEKRDSEVAGVFMIDTYPPLALSEKTTYEFGLDSELELLSDFLNGSLSGLTKMTDIQELWREVADITKADTELATLAKQWVPDDFKHIIPHFDNLDAIDLIRYVNTIRSLRQGLLSHQPNRQVQAPIYYFQAADSSLKYAVLSKYFGAPAALLEIPGNHLTMMAKPHVQTLGLELKNSLNSLSPD